MDVLDKETLTATAMAREWILASASTTFELMKPPYDWRKVRHRLVDKAGTPLTHPQIPIRLGSTYGLAAHSLCDPLMGGSRFILGIILSGCDLIPGLPEAKVALYRIPVFSASESRTPPVNDDDNVL